MAKKPSLPKHVRINRAKQLDPQNPTYHRGRGASPDEAAKQAAEVTQANQDAAEQTSSESSDS